MLEFFIFASVTAITPGPNNSMLMASGIKFGRRPSIPHFLGIWLGFTFLFFVGGYILSFVPSEVFTYLIATTKTSTDKSKIEKPFTFIQACLFQWVNPKGVVMAISGLTAFNITHLQGTLIYFSVLPFCVGIWLLLGEKLQNWLRKNSTLERTVYIFLGLSMIASLLLA